MAAMCNDPNLGMPQALIDLMQEAPSIIDNNALTEISLDGAGVFDRLVQAIRLNLQAEYDSSRISGDQYAKALVALMEAAMQNSVQFLLQRDQAKYAALNALVQAYKTKADIFAVCAQIDLTRAQITKINFEVSQLLPAQVSNMTAQTAKLTYETSQLMPAQRDQLLAQTILTESQTDKVDYEVSDLMPTQKDNIIAQTELYGQQIASFKAKDWIQGLQIMQSVWAAAKSVEIETPTPKWADANETGGGGLSVTSAVEGYINAYNSP